MAMEVLDVGRSTVEIKAALAGCVRANEHEPLLGTSKIRLTLLKRETVVSAIDGGYEISNTEPIFLLSHKWPTEYVARVIFIGSEAFIKFRTTTLVLIGTWFVLLCLGGLVTLLSISGDYVLAIIVLIPYVLLFFLMRYKRQRFRKIIFDFLKKI